MAVANYAASVQGVCLRLTRLAANGTPMVGPNSVYVTRAFMRVSFTPEYEEGDEVTEKNAAGEVCITYKALDTLKRATMELAICEPDPEVTELLSGGTLLTLPSDFADPALADATVGYAAGRVGEAPNPNGVGLEVWSMAIRDGAKDNTLPYFRWVFPKANLRPSGDRVIENGVLANAFEGFSVGNMGFGTGPVDDWPWPDATDSPYLYARDNEIPWTGTNGWQDNTGSVSEAGIAKGVTGHGIIYDDPQTPEYEPQVYPGEGIAGATGPTGP